MTPERLEVIKNSLDRRQPDLTVIMDNVRKPHNLAAVARTLEAVGGLNVHAVSALQSLRLSQLAAGGIRKWMIVHKHASIDEALDLLKQQGHRIVATSPGDNAKDYRDVDYTQPTAVLVGEELDGISKRGIELADETITIPIVGMVQSLNVSVASALVLYEAYRQRDRVGMYNRRLLDDATYERLLFEACHPGIAQYCREKNVAYPTIDENAGLLEPVAESASFGADDVGSPLKKVNKL